MLEMLSRNWWIFLVRGLLAIAFGVVAMIWPGITVLALVLLFGVYVLLDGIIDVGAAISGRGVGAQQLSGGHRVLLGLIGLVGVAAAVIAFFWPAITALALLFVIAWWAIIRGVLEIVAAWRLRAELTNEWMWVLSGLLSIALGVILIARPGTGALALVLLIAAFSIAWGVALCIVAFRIRGLTGEDRPAAAAT